MVKPALSPEEGVVLLAKLAKYDDGGDDGDDCNNNDLDLVPGGRGCSPCQAPTGSCSSSSATTPATSSGQLRPPTLQQEQGSGLFRFFLPESERQGLARHGEYRLCL